MEQEFSPKTLLQAITYFSDVEVATDFMVRLRWPGGVTCPRCQQKNVTLLARVTRQQSRRIWNCKDCRKQFGVKVGTVMEDSPIGLDKWLPAFWLLSSAKNGISSCELARALGVTQKSAWFILHRIRLAMQQGTIEKMNGSVEADETFVGGLEKNKHKDKKLNAGRGPVGKTIVLGVLERNEDEVSQVRAKVIAERTQETLYAEIKKDVAAFSELYTDAWRGYRGLSPEYIHQFVDHAVNYAIGRVHTNGLENFWALLKRALKGTYVSVEPFHLFRYLDEQVLRFNSRAYGDGDRFKMALGSIAGKRVTYAELTTSYMAYYDEVLPRQ